MSKLRHTGRWRQILGYALALGFCIAGLVVSAAGIRFGLSKNDFEDVAAATAKALTVPFEGPQAVDNAVLRGFPGQHVANQLTAHPAPGRGR